MKVDYYTKFVLSIIAICLTVMTLKNVDLIPTAYASEPKNINLPPTKNYGLVPVNEDGSITVKLSSSAPIDVVIRNIVANECLNVNLKKIDGESLFNSSPLNVKIKN